MAHKQIGIIGGIGPSATILYYQEIIQSYSKRKDDQHFPRMVIHSLDFAEVNECFETGDLETLADELVRVVGNLKEGGCHFAVFACNAMHLVFQQVRQRVSLPMLSIVDCVLQDVKRRKIKKVGLMGTTFVVRSGIYRDPLESSGIGCLLLDEKEQEWVMEAIQHDLQMWPVSQRTIRRLVKDVDKLGRNGAEGVILGCTDLPVAITEQTSRVPLIDSTKIHVKAILDWALCEKERT